MATPIPVIIHFVGLALFSSQVPNDCGVKVILPTVIYTDPRIVTAAAQTQARRLAKAAATSSVQPIGPVPHVQDHVALLVFPAA
ncbi:MAG TPA: hypothetical protein VNN08_07340, partial [Thermoanaerobaculia bacterium]|nr:hypothetical protein [Thermoanaerobaculia bacterium]